MPERLRKLLGRFLSEAINLRAGDYFMEQGRMTAAQATRDMLQRIAGLDKLSSEVRQAFNAWGETRERQKRMTRAQRRLSRKAKRGW